MILSPQWLALSLSLSLPSPSLSPLPLLSLSLSLSLMYYHSLFKFSFYPLFLILAAFMHMYIVYYTCRHMEQRMTEC